MFLKFRNIYFNIFIDKSNEKWHYFIMHKLIFIIVVFMLFTNGCASMPDMSHQRQDFISSHPNITQSIKNDILEGRLSIGMTKEECIASWGSLSYNNIPYSRTYNSFGCTEIYITGNKYCLTFQDNKLISVSEVNY